MSNQSACTPCQLLDQLFSAYTNWPPPRRLPATYCTSGNSVRIAVASSSVSVKLFAPPTRIPPKPRPDPGLMSRRLEPRPETSLSISACVPCPTDTITITAAMPMITPSEVSALRNQLPRRAKTAVRRISRKFMAVLQVLRCRPWRNRPVLQPPARPSKAGRSSAQPMPKGIGCADSPVPHHEDAIAMLRHIRIVCDQHHGVVFLLQALEHSQDLLAGAAVERAGRLVGEQDRWAVDQRSRDGDALLLSAGQLVRAMPGAFAQAHGFQRVTCTLQSLLALDVGVAHGHRHVLQ